MTRLPTPEVGHTNGRLRVVEVGLRGDPPPSHVARGDLQGPYAARCLCDPALGGCGTEKIVLYGNWRRGNTVSCGCYRAEQFTQNASEFGRAGGRARQALLTAEVRSENGRKSWRTRRADRSAEELLDQRELALDARELMLDIRSLELGVTQLDSVNCETRTELDDLADFVEQRHQEELAGLRMLEVDLTLRGLLT